jgi:hypothetical protein
VRIIAALRESLFRVSFDVFFQGFDVYLDDHGMLANHITGRDPWDLLVKGAGAAGWVILPVGCPTCLTHEDQERDLPDELRERVVIVRSGADLLRAIETA